MDISTIHLGGWKRQEADPRDYNIEHEKIAPHIKITTAPIKWVLSDKDTPIKDQRTYGSCTAFAGTGGVMYWLKQMNLFKDLSEFFLYWWSRVIDTGGDPTGDDGSTIRSMMSALVKYGVPPEIEFPYLDSNFNKKPPVVKDAVTVAKYYAIAEDSSKVANMKQSIYSGVPVVFGSEVGNGIFNVGKDGKEPYELKYVGGHARVCLDYDDTMVIPGTKVLGAFRVRNSWTSAWGDKGYSWVSYAVFQKQQTDCMGIILVNEPVAPVNPPVDDCPTVIANVRSIAYGSLTATKKVNQIQTVVGKTPT